MAHHADIGILVVAHRETVLQQFVVMPLESLGHVHGVIGRHAELDQHLGAQTDGGEEGFALEDLDAHGHQFVGVATIDGAGGDGDRGEMLAQVAGDGKDTVPPADGDDYQFGLVDAGGVQQIEP
ncbi:hypothetical protein D3C72_1729700 [compost metagenome]